MLRRALLSLVLPAALAGQTAGEHFAMGRTAYEANNLDAAVRSFERAVELNDKAPEYHLWLGRALQRQLEHTNILRQAFVAKRARAEFEHAIQLEPSGIGAREGLLALYLEVPPGLGGSVSKARDNADTIARLNPLRGHFARASIADRERNPEGMETEFRAAIAEYPDSAVARAQLVRFFLNKKRPDDAFAAVDAWQARSPHDLRALFQLGVVAVATGDQLDRGEHAMRQVIAVLDSMGIHDDPSAPNAANVHLRLGDLLVKKGARDEARREYQTALDLNPKLEAARKALRAP